MIGGQESIKVFLAMVAINFASMQTCVPMLVGHWSSLTCGRRYAMLNWTNFLITEGESIHDCYLFIPVDTSPFVVVQLSIGDHDLQPVVIVASFPGLWAGL